MPGIYIGVSKNSGENPQIIRFNRVFHEINHPIWVETPIYIYICFFYKSLQEWVDFSISTNGKWVVWDPVVWDSNQGTPKNSNHKGIPGIQTTGPQTTN